MTVTIYDIAKKLGTTGATVSRGLRDDPEIAAKTRERIKKMAKEIGYRPNAVARSLRTKKSGCIGVVATGASLQSYPVGLAEAVAVEQQYEVLVGVTRWGNNGNSEESEIKRLLNRNVDGILLIPPALHHGRRELLETLLAQNFPLVSVGSSLNDNSDFVGWDRENAYAQLTAHLIKRGCQKLVCFMNGSSPGVDERLRGVKRTIETYEASVDLQIIGNDLNFYECNGVDGLISIFMQHVAKFGWPDGVIGHTDRQAVAVIQAAKMNGVSVPRELAVTGCSNTEFSAYIDPPITTIQTPLQEIVTRATTRLLEKIANPNDNDHLKLLLPATPIIRASSMFGGTESFFPGETQRYAPL